MENNSEMKLKSANSLFKEFVLPYHPDTTFREFADRFQSEYKKEKALGFPDSDIVWLNKWFSKNGEAYKSLAEKNKYVSDEYNEQTNINEEKQEQPKVEPAKQKLIWGVKPVYFYSATALVVGFAILALVSASKSSDK